MKIALKFSNALFKARTEQKYTQSEVAEAVSITVRWYQKIEAGSCLPGSLTMLRLILFLHIDVEKFREEAELIVPVSSNKRKLSLR